jgi:ribonuclease HI
MAYQEMKFKGQRVFVLVDEAGELVLEGGRARMKYKLDDSREYSPYPRNLTDLNGPAMPMPLGATTKPKKPKKSAKPKGIVDPGAVVSYTDGACLGNPGPSGLGYFIAFPDGREIARGEPLGQGTNNIAELTAIERVLELVEDKETHLVIHTDSSYSIGVLTLGWKAKANQALIGRIKRKLAGFTDVELRKVKGHAGIPENELVDNLARTAAETQRPADS